MNPHDLPPLLHRLAVAGLTLRLVDCNRIEVLGFGLSDELRQGIRELKPLLVELLTPPPPRQPACPKCGSDDLADGKYSTWCLACEERVAIQSEHSLEALAGLREAVAWFERRDRWQQGDSMRLLAGGRIGETPSACQAEGVSDPTSCRTKR